MAIVNRIFTVLGKPADEKDIQVRYKVEINDHTWFISLVVLRGKSSQSIQID